MAGTFFVGLSSPTIKAIDECWDGGGVWIMAMPFISALGAA
jgi:hypothetical protein